jgi:photosystem II stability/assembly factor-like uncharacterized protein
MLYLSTTQGIVRIDPETGQVARLGPDGVSTEALAVAGDVILAAVTPDYGLPMRQPLRPAGRRGMLRSADGGRTWSPVAGPLAGQQITALAAASAGTATAPRCLAGTDPAELFVSTDGGVSWEQGQSLREMPGYERWSYPLPPHTPHVMAIVPHPVEPDVIYAGIEVGGIVRTRDGGRTWQVIGDRPGAAVHPDIHGLAICPAAPSVIYAATPQGVYYSSDGGERWERRIDGLDPLYCRPIVTHQEEPDVAVVVVTHGASGFFGIAPERTGGAVFRTEDAGRTWSPVSRGLPAVLQPTPAIAPDPRRPGRFYLPLFSGDVYVTDDGGATWQELARGLPPILRAVTA